MADDPANPRSAADQPPTRQASRTLVDRLAPVAVLLVGMAYVAVALSRLNGIYDSDPGVLRSVQLAPRSVGMGQGLATALFKAIRPTGLGARLCERPHFADRCIDTTEDPDASPGPDELRETARRLVGGSAPDTIDVTTAGWKAGPAQTVAVAVARFPNAAAAAEAVTAALAAATGPGDTVTEHPVARAAWAAGDHLVIGVVASAYDQDLADRALARTRPQVSASLAMSRVLWFEALAIGPLLVLFTTWVLARYLLFVLYAVLFATAALVAIAVFLPILAFVLVRRRFARRRSSDERGAALAPAAPAEGLPAVRRYISVPSTWVGQQPEGQYASLVVILLIGFGIAAMTTQLFPGSIAGGSLALAVLGATQRRTWSTARRKAVRGVVLGLVAAVGASVLFGLAPLGLMSRLPLQFAGAILGIAVIVSQWRVLTAGTALTYTKWYEDIDARSTVFLLGAALLIVGAGAIFLGGNGSSDVRAQLGDKALAAPGLLVALAASANVRASRDAARRDKARERGTPSVLYLRSFGDDRLRVVSPRLQRAGLERLSWRRRELFEDVIVRSLSRMGPVVSIARPGTGQRDLGAARDSIVTEDWLGAVRTYMGEAVLVAVVLGSSDGLVRELETLGELGLLDRVCLFVPPVNDVEVTRRLAALGRQRGYSNTWGTLTDGKNSRILALTSIGPDKAVVGGSKRTAYAYRACIAELALAPAPVQPGIP